MLEIKKPGIYRGIHDADYRMDPCPAPSLTQSLCKTLLERAPLHAWHQNPRLNPNYEPDDDTKFDLGNVAHRLMLGRGKNIDVIQFPDWRKKEAQELRAESAANGRHAVLEHQHKQAVDMVMVAHAQLKTHEDADAFTNGAAEVMIAWEEDGIWFRSLIDWLHDDLRTVDDYKTTAMSVAPHSIGRVAQSAGWETQAAFIERGLDVLDPANAGRRRFRFIAQETEQPFALTVQHMDETWMTMGRKHVSAATALWCDAVRNSDWPGYGSRAVIPEYPNFKMNEFLAREENEFAEPIKRGPMLKSLMGG